MGPFQASRADHAKLKNGNGLTATEGEAKERLDKLTAGSRPTPYMVMVVVVVKPKGVRRQKRFNRGERENVDAGQQSS